MNAFINISIVLFFFSSLGVCQNLPSGKIGFTSTRDGNYEVYSMNADGTNPVNLSNNPKTDYAFSWSKNGNKITFYTNRDGNNEIYIMNSDGSGQINITNHTSSDRIPSFSHDAKNIVFVSDRDHESGEIYIMKVNGKETHRITKNQYFEESPSFSKNGKQLLFTRDIKDPNDSTSVSNGELYLLNLKTKKEIRLTNKKGYDSGGSFSPDEKKIAFYGKDEKTGHYDIFIMNSDGSQLQNLTNDALEDYSPAWAPDGKWLAFTRGNSQNYDIWIMNIKSKDMIRLTIQPKRDETPFWTSKK